MRRIVLTLLILISSLAALANGEVAWSYKIIGDNTPNPVLELTANVKPGFHMYSQDNPEAGGVPLSFRFNCKGCKTDEIGRAHV